MFPPYCAAWRWEEQAGREETGAGAWASGLARTACTLWKGTDAHEGRETRVGAELPSLRRERGDVGRRNSLTEKRKSPATGPDDAGMKRWGGLLSRQSTVCTLESTWINLVVLIQTSAFSWITLERWQTELGKQVDALTFCSQKKMNLCKSRNYIVVLVFLIANIMGRVS